MVASIALHMAGAITGIEIEEIDGAITRFTFSGEVPDAAIPPGAFQPKA